jgi:hypothetical protein
VKTIRRTPCSPVYGAKARLSSGGPSGPPTGLSYRQVYAEVITARDEGSRVEYRWEPWVRA